MFTQQSYSGTLNYLKGNRIAALLRRPKPKENPEAPRMRAGPGPELIMALLGRHRARTGRSRGDTAG
ncbi:hypothetical protein GCM10009780_65100 [Actinomadura alba]